MKHVAKEFFNTFQKNPDVWFFYMFLATSTLSTRKIIYSLKIDSFFNEYTGAYIYLSDIFLILTFISFILCNNKLLLSNIKTLLARFFTQLQMFHVEHFKIKNIYTINCFTCPKCHLSKFISENDNLEINCFTWNKTKVIVKNVPRGTFLLFKKTYAHIVNNYLTIFPLFIAFFAFLSILWTTNKSIALYRSIKLLEFIVLYFYITCIVPRGTFLNNIRVQLESIIKFKQCFKYISQLFHVEQLKNNHSNRDILNNKNIVNCSTWNNSESQSIVSPARNATSQALYKGSIIDQLNVPRGTFLKNIFFIIIATGVLQSLIGIWQFLLQRSIGLFWLKESIISPNMPGVAKIILDQEVYIRAYGLFPHPNIFGGYLALSIMLTLLLLKMFHVEHFDKTKDTSRESISNCSTWNNSKKQIFNIVPRGTIWKYFMAGRHGTILLHMFLFIQITALLLTFSKSAILGLFIGLIYIYTNKKEDLFHVEQIKIKLLITLITLITFYLFIKPDVDSLFLKSLQEREFYTIVSRGTILEHPFLGIGAGQFIFQLANIPDIQPWQFQPVHNVFLLIANEYGLIVMAGFIFFLYRLFKQSNNDFSYLIYLKGVLLAFTFIMFFDHYLWDIQQGQILLWLLLALVASATKHCQAKV